MRRHDAENLIHHHYRLHAKITSVVDTSPPHCMYRSPKSIHYKPFVQTRPRSVEPGRLGRPPVRRYGQEELAHFLGRRLPDATTSHSHNAFARSSSAMSLLSNKRVPSMWDDVKPRILGSRNYQPPMRRPNSTAPTISAKGSTRSTPNALLPRGSISSLPTGKPSIANTRAQLAAAASATQLSYYRMFKESVLNDIMLRGVFSDRIILDCVNRTSATFRNLDPRLKDKAISEIMVTLGVPSSVDVPPSAIKRDDTRRHVTIAKEPPGAKPQVKLDLDDVPSASVSSVPSGSSVSTASKASTAESSRRSSSATHEASSSDASSSEGQTTVRSSSTEDSGSHESGSLYKTSSEDFDMDAPPPRALDSSTDLDELAKRLSNVAENRPADDFAERESSLFSLDDEDLEQAASHSRRRRLSSGLEDIMERARLMDA